MHFFRWVACGICKCRLICLSLVSSADISHLFYHVSLWNIFTNAGSWKREDTRRGVGVVRLRKLFHRNTVPSQVKRVEELSAKEASLIFSFKMALCILDNRHLKELSSCIN
jgi:hypothetical protein